MNTLPIQIRFLTRYHAAMARFGASKVRAMFAFGAFSLANLWFSNAHAAPGLLDCQSPPSLLPATEQRSQDEAISVTVRSAEELVSAVNKATANSEIVLQPGTYNMSSTLWVSKADLTIRGNGSACDKVVLQGPGMDNKAGNDAAPYGIWSDSPGLSVQNLTIQGYYTHGIILNANAHEPHLYNIRILDTGQQQFKANPQGFGQGVRDGLIEYSVFAYTEGPSQIDHGAGIGYSNGVDIHGGQNFVIRHCSFANFHTPDSAAYLWNPAVLAWNGAKNTLVENSRFHNVDRAIAYGLLDRENDHYGGIIRNNMISLDAQLLSESRRRDADALIVVYSSPETKVLHNTIISQQNTPKSIELRFNSSDTLVANNLSDAPVGNRNDFAWQTANNFTSAEPTWFVNVDQSNLRLHSPVDSIANMAQALPSALEDLDGNRRDEAVGKNPAGKADIGAHEFTLLFSDRSGDAPANPPSASPSPSPTPIPQASPSPEDMPPQATATPLPQATKLPTTKERSAPKSPSNIGISVQP